MTLNGGAIEKDVIRSTLPCNTITYKALSKRRRSNADRATHKLPLVSAFVILWYAVYGTHNMYHNSSINTRFLPFSVSPCSAKK